MKFLGSFCLIAVMLVASPSAPADRPENKRINRDAPLKPEPAIDLRVVHKIKLVSNEKWNPYAYANPAQLDDDAEWEFVLTCGELFTRAYDWDGTLLWQREDKGGKKVRNIWHEVVTPTWDLDGDGIDEVITFARIRGKHHILVLDGRTGKIKHSYEHKQKTTDLRAIVYFPKADGKPYIAMAGGDNLHRVLILDAELNLLHSVKTKDATHHLFHYDIDGDGTHELLAGRYVIDGDGKIIWDLTDHLPTHADALMVADVIAEQPGLELFICDNNSLTFMFNIPQRKLLWKTTDADDNNDTLIAELDGTPGYELITKEEGTKQTCYLTHDGEVRKTGLGWPPTFMAVDLDGTRDRLELAAYRGAFRRYPALQHIVPRDWFYKDIPGSEPTDWHPYPIVTDLLGDSREEVVMWGADYLIIGQNQADPPVKLGKSWRGDREYMLRTRNRCLNRASQFFEYREAVRKAAENPAKRGELP